MTGLFDHLPTHPLPLPQSALRLWRGLPRWPITTAVDCDREADARRLERLGLVRVRRERDDPLAIRPTLYAGAA